MKRILLLLFAALPSIIAAQNYFELTEHGLKVANDADAKYIILEKDGTQIELYNKIKTFIGSTFVSPKDVMSEIEYSTITINGISSKDITVKKALGYLDITMNYTIVFHFKDGKIRVDIPSINKMTSKSTSTSWQLTINQEDYYDYNIYERFYIFDKKGKLKNKTAKDEIESFFNSFIDKAINFESPVNEDW